MYFIRTMRFSKERKPILAIEPRVVGHPKSPVRHWHVIILGRHFCIMPLSPKGYMGRLAMVFTRSVPIGAANLFLAICRSENRDSRKPNSVSRFLAEKTVKNGDKRASEKTGKER